MTDFTMLDTNTHRNTRIIQGRGAKFGENVHLVPVIAEELHKLVLEYPICLIKNNETGQFGLNALLGFDVGENLFLHNDEWQADYVPLHIRRQPFMVAVKGEEGEAPSPDNTVITINNANTRVQDIEGELIFDGSGNLTPYMHEMNTLLSSLVNGIIRTDAFIASLSEHNLIEAIQLKIALKDGTEKVFDGVYTINEENFNNLSNDVVANFHQNGYLQACYMLKISMGNIQKLITLKNKT